MIYLLLQMLVALSLAVLLGAAIGWLVHRSTHAARVHELHQGLVRQQSQLNQAQSEIAMLSDDYDEMHRRTQDELEALRQENQQIPFLRTNLEKSQLLVRQMMQKHEAKVRDLTGENKTLTSRIKSIEDREQTYNKVQAELDNRRREKKRLADTPPEESSQTYQAAAADSSPESIVTSTISPKLQNASALSAAPSDTSDESDLLTSTRNSNTKPSASWASEPIALDSTLDSDAPKTIDIDADADPFDEVMEVGDELQRELSGALPDSTDNNGAISASLASASIDDSSQTDNLDNKKPDSSQTNRSSPSLDSASTEHLDFELPGSDEKLHSDRMLDGSSDASSLFEPVEQRDDLQQIFGIGPVTEKALNDMGITSYSQLATLKHHQIQSIADTLQIVPGRIERDDWMGNARRQLEDVLEQL